MKNNIVGILIGITIVALVIYVLATSRKDQYKNIPLSTVNYISNETDKKYLDTIVDATLSELKLENITIVIKPLSKVAINSYDKSFNLQATIRGNNSHYTIYVNPNLGKNASTRVIAHEMIHLQQFETQSLEVRIGGVVFWQNKEVELANLPYEERLWEREAFDRESDLNDRVREKILK